VTIRQFARANADFARCILIGNPKLASKMYARVGMPESYKQFSFDFADACKHGMSPGVHEAILRSKMKNLKQAGPERAPGFSGVSTTISGPEGEFYGAGSSIPSHLL